MAHQCLHTMLSYLSVWAGPALGEAPAAGAGAEAEEGA